MGEIDRVRTAIAAIKKDAPDAEVNRLCALAFGWEHKECWDFCKYTMWSRDGFSTEHLPQYTESLDAIMAEIKHRCVFMKIEWCGIWDVPCVVTIGATHPTYVGSAETPHRALLIAILHAMEAQNA